LYVPRTFSAPPTSPVDLRAGSVTRSRTSWGTRPGLHDTARQTPR
jgi:hypothetical protein